MKWLAVALVAALLLLQYRLWLSNDGVSEVLRLRSAVAVKSRSMLPSMMLESYLPSSAADRFRTARGNRALRREVIVGLINSMCRVGLMTGSAPAPASE